MWKIAHGPHGSANGSGRLAGMYAVRRIAYWSSALALVVGLVLAAYWFGARNAFETTHLTGERQLQIIALDLEAVLDRFDTLPYSVAHLPMTAQALATPTQDALVHELNETLKDLQQQAKVAAIYLMDQKGKPGYFYAIGNTTSIPDYFISQPVYPVGARRATVAPIGVIAVKITLEAFEQIWRSNEDPIALTDRQGVVFLSNRSEWNYRSLRPLEPAVQEDLGKTLQYMGQKIDPVASLPTQARNGFGNYVARPVGRLGWQLMLFPAQRKIVRVGLQAADELEQKIAQRTQKLLSANTQLASKYGKRQQAENLLRSTRNEMVQAGKLAMLGQMAAGITHELNQPLTAIRAFADNASTFLSRGQVAQADDNLRHISAANARMGNIVGQLKGFARKSPEAVAVVNVNQAIQGAALLLDSEFTRQAVQLELHMPHTFHVLGDTVRVEQVLINLMRNALDAVENAPEKKVQLVLEADVQQVTIRILDSGSGLPQDVVKHLFEPFFTTKATGHGLGLGLAISSSIVQAMDGHLEAKNRVPCGAEFVVSIPRCTEAKI